MVEKIACVQRHLRVLVAVVAALGVIAVTVPSVAGAATVGLHRGKLQFTAGRGERNALTVTQSRGRFMFRDARARIKSGRGCKGNPRTHAVTCKPKGVTAVQVSLGDRNDTFSAGPAVRMHLSVRGGTGDDLLRGGVGRDTLRGNGGNDTLDGRGGADVLQGGAGTDTVDYSSRTTAVTVSLDGRAASGAGGERDAVAGDVENVLGGAGGDTLIGNGANNKLIGNGGNDTLQGFSGTDLIDGGGGSDVVSYAERTSPVKVTLDRIANDGAPGENDRIANVEGIQGGAGSDTLIGDNGANRISGDAGNDAIDGLGGDDAVAGGDGDDTIAGNTGNDVAFLGAGDDTSIWNPGDGNDSIDGQAGNDTLQFNGSDANEHVGVSANGAQLRLTDDVGSVAMDVGGTENVRLQAVGGLDDVRVSDLAGTATSTVHVDLGAGDGSPDSVEMTGTGGSDTISAGVIGGETVVTGLAAQVAIAHAAENDLLRIDGLAGSDQMSADPSLLTIVASGDEGSDTVTALGTEGPDAFGISPLPGSQGVRVTRDGHTVQAEAENLEVAARGGNDTINGGTGLKATAVSLTIDGGAGDDTINGADGNDLLLGGDGNDTIAGNAGNDVAFLGAGDDTFVWSPGDGNDIVEGQAGSDTLKFNGSTAPEQLDLSSNGGRLRLTRDVGNVVMDANDLENVAIKALDGLDGLTVHDLGGTAVKSLRMDLAGGANPNAGDGQSEVVDLVGTAGPDAITASDVNGETVVDGLPAKVTIAGADNPGGGNGDVLRINASGGDDSVSADPTLMPMVILGGTGTDTVTSLGTENADTFNLTADFPAVRVVRDGHGLSAEAENVGADGLGGNDNITAGTGFAALGVRLTLTGGPGTDTITGSDAGDTINGGDDADLLIGNAGIDDVDGGPGGDTALLGADNDTFRWNPGDGSDTVEGQAGVDGLKFNGADVAENVDLSANGPRLRLFRDVANVTMDVNGVEGVDVLAHGGADHVHVGSLDGTAVGRAGIDLAGAGTSGDGQGDTVSVDGTAGPDFVSVGGSPAVGAAQVLGLAASVMVAHPEGNLDALIVNGLGGADTLNAAALASSAIKLVEDGGAGSDTLDGSQGADTIVGGDGSDITFPGGGDDTVLMGAGSDTAVWNPGDGSDTVEGQDGTDTLQFNGANIAERIDLSASGSRLRFTRDVASIIMDVNGTENVRFQARGGADKVHVGDVTGTDVQSVALDLGSGNGTGDGAADSVSVDGSTAADAAVITGDSSGVDVSGLGPKVSITHAEADRDELLVNGLGGDDAIEASGLPAGLIHLTEDGGADDDLLIGSSGDDILHGGDGDDELIGGPGIDTLDGGSGNNILIQ